MDPSSALPPNINEYRGNDLVIVASVMIALQLAAVSARFYARRLTKAPFALDDWLIIPALVSGIAFCCVAIVGVYVGYLGHHTSWVFLNHPEKLYTWGKYLFTLEVTQIPLPITFAKLSILAFIRRVFPGPDVRAASVAIGSFVIAHAFIVVIVIIFHCQPIARFWDPSIPGTCIDELAWARYVSVPNILSDAALMVLPLPSIWKIQISWQQRLGLSTIFILGGFNIVASAIRVTYFFSYDYANDPFWISNQLHIWCVLEASTAVIAACLPSLYPLFRQAVRWRPLSGGSSSKAALTLESGVSASAWRSPAPRSWDSPPAPGWMEPQEMAASCEKVFGREQPVEMGVAGRSASRSASPRLREPLLDRGAADVEKGTRVRAAPVG